MEQQLQKAQDFIQDALDSVHKHFPRWKSELLFPAGLLAENALAQCFASVIRHRELPQELTEVVLESAVHGENIDLEDFYLWLKKDLPTNDKGELLSDDGSRVRGYFPQVHRAAEGLLDDGLMLGDTDNFTADQCFLFTHYLGLASTTHNVERGVKEAANVSNTGRHEPFRTVYAINRDANVLSIPDWSTLSETAKIEALIKSTKDHVELHQQLFDADPGYETAVKAIDELLYKEHSSVELKQEKIDAIIEKATIMRPGNKLSRATGVTSTLKYTGMITYRQCLKDEHTLDLMEEFSERPPLSVKQQEIYDSGGWVARKGVLKDLEIMRVAGLEYANDDLRLNAIELAKKAFIPQSSKAKFSPREATS